MPEIVTRQFGPLEYTEESVLHFPGGIPAFEDHTRFLLIEQDSYAPFLFLQSVVDGHLSFLVLPVNRIDPAYQLQLEAEEMETLQIDDPSSPLVTLAVVTLIAGGTPSANLVAPILINMTNQVGLQCIQSASNYSHQTPLALREEGC